MANFRLGGSSSRVRSVPAPSLSDSLVLRPDVCRPLPEGPGIAVRMGAVRCGALGHSRDFGLSWRCIGLLSRYGRAGHDLKLTNELAERALAGYARPMSSKTFTFGPFLLDSARRTLTRDGATTEIGQRGSVLLQVLLQAEGEPVSKAALMDQAWPGTVVEEGNLTVQIAQLRKLLGTDPEGRDWIVTVPRVGYRLVLPQTPRTQASETPRPALAVLPFVNLSGDPEQDYFADGVVEDIITALSKFKSFAVIARSSSFVYKGRLVDVRKVAQELGVRYVLEGSVRRSQDRLRISTQLVECTSGQHIWAEHFNGELPEVFDMQDRITERVAALVEPTVKRAEVERARQKRPERLDAYDLYLQALPDVFTNWPEAVARAIDLLERSVALDPNFAPAVAMLGIAYTGRQSMQFGGVSDADRERLLTLAAAALKIAGNDATVLASCGFMFIQVGGEYETGLALLQRAVSENPNNLSVDPCGHRRIAGRRSRRSGAVSAARASVEPQ
jgi:TolB-like protein